MKVKSLIIFLVLTAALFPCLSGLDAAVEPKFPDFLIKVQLHNFAGVEPTDDGNGVKLYRVPGNVRVHLTEPNRVGSTGATQMRRARHSEIRFVLNEGTKPEDVKIYLQTIDDAAITLFWGDIFSGELVLKGGVESQPVIPQGHPVLYHYMEQIPPGRFPNELFRIVISGGEITLTGVEGDIRPPTAEELPPVMMSYGTSITHGAFASRSDLAWNALTARALGYDLINLGSAGTAFCQPELADYMGKQSWDISVLEISVNMVGSEFSIDEFRKRATYMIETLAKSHPDAPVIAISIFPYGVGDYSFDSPTYQRVREFRRVLEEICRETPYHNVFFIAGPDLLSFSGLSRDLLHPSDHGMIEISINLTERIREIIEYMGE